jgi:hypothetical protein
MTYYNGTRRGGSGLIDVVRHGENGGPGGPRTAIAPATLVVPRHPLLAGHAGTPPDLLLRWGPMASGDVVDVVVHLHGHSGAGRAMRIDREKAPRSGLDLSDPTGREPGGRTAPTLLVLPRGHFTGSNGGRGYGFPALTPPNALRTLVDDALARFAARTGARPRLGRLILTAHSGGGGALMSVLRHLDPDEVHSFDALYNDPSALIAWARRRQAGGTGALRVLFRAGEGTARNSAAVAAALNPGSPRFRVESTRVPHDLIPPTFGWRLLADAGADLPRTGRRPLPPIPLPPGPLPPGPLPPGPSPIGGPLLRRGSVGPAVRRVQIDLRRLGFPLRLDGRFGPRTEGAVRTFQARAGGLRVDGIVGPRTRAAIAAALRGRPVPVPPVPVPVPPVPVPPVPGGVITPTPDRLAGRVVRGTFIRCTTGPQPGATALGRQWTRLTGRLAGTFNCRATAAGTPSLHGEGRSIDCHGFATRPAERAQAEAYIRWLMDNAVELQVAVIIWNRRIWSFARRAEGFRPYTLTPHTDHFHIDLSREGAATPSPLFAGGVPGFGPPPGPPVPVPPGPIPPVPVPPLPVPAGAVRDRALRAMRLLVERYGYPVNGAAGIVGNLWAESAVMTERLEGSREGTPMRAADFSGVVRDFTPEEIRDRSFAARRGPRLPGIGIIQFTFPPLRAGLFTHVFEGRSGVGILRDLPAQVDYLNTRLGPPGLVRVLRDPGVGVDRASDEVVYRFGVPATFLEGGTKRPREHPAVQAEFRRRRVFARLAQQIYTTAPR